MLVLEEKDERRLVCDELSRLLAAELPPGRPSVDDDAQRRAWALAAERGYAGVLVPARCGGAGFELAEAQPILRAAGATLASGPLLPSAVVAPLVLAAASDPGCNRLLERIAAGEVTVAVAADSRLLGSARRAVRLEPGGDPVLEGSIDSVLGGMFADVFLVVFEDEAAEGALALVAREAEGLACGPVPHLDLSRGWSSLTLSGVLPEHLVLGLDAPVGEIADAATLTGMALEMVGGAAATLQRTLEQVNGRRQFGRPVGSFQAIKHRLADCLVELESAVSAVSRAACLCVAGGWSCRDAAVAKLAASAAYTRIADSYVQLCGALGVTWEHDAHLHLRRALTDRIAGGGEEACMRLVHDAGTELLERV